MSSFFFIAYYKKYIGLFVRDFFISRELTYEVCSHKKVYFWGILSDRVALRAKILESLFKIKAKS